jgi:hypothetical protein
MATDRSAARSAGRPNLPKVSVGTGAAANANIAVTGIRKGTDVVDVVLFFPKAAEPLPTDVSSEASITSDGNIQLSTTNTTSGKLVVFWRKRR